MALPRPISPSQTDAKSPVDDDLMDSIREDLDYLDSQVTSAAFVFGWNINGPLSSFKRYRRALDTAPIYKDFVPLNVRAVLRHGGISGNLIFDIRRHQRCEFPITEIANQFVDSTQAITNIAPALATQSVTQATPSIATQTITRFKTAINVNSIIKVPGTNRWRYNLAATPDADWAVGDSMTFAGCASAGNNGQFAAVEVNQSEFPSVVVVNAAGVAQLAASGTVNLDAWSYNYINPVSSQFVVGELAVLNGHTTIGNDGFFGFLFIYAVNSGGNNLIFKNGAGAAQGAAAGTARTTRWVYTFLTPPSATDFVVGEQAKMSGHTSAGNDGNLVIRAVNSGGNNLNVSNPVGVLQAGVAGTTNTNRWIYTVLNDNSANVVAGDTAFFSGHTTAANNGLFTVGQVNRSALNNIVIHNINGVAQAGVAGIVNHTRKLVKFAVNHAAVFTTLSFVDIQGCPDGSYNKTDVRAPYQVLQVNRGGGSNFNIVIDVPIGLSQASPAGYVMTEMKSVFTGSPPSIPVDKAGILTNDWLTFSTTALVAGTIPANTPIGLYLLSVPIGAPSDLSVTMH